MKKQIRVIALLLILAMTVAAFSVAASAGTYKSGTNIAASVQTSKAPWYLCWQKPQVRVYNDGNTTMTVNVQNSRGQLVKTVTALKPGKSATISLSGNSTYTIYWSGNTLSGGSYKAKGYIEGVRYISSIR